jgi:hypothetical protein
MPLSEIAQRAELIGGMDQVTRALDHVRDERLCAFRRSTRSRAFGQSSDELRHRIRHESGHFLSFFAQFTQRNDVWGQ